MNKGKSIFVILLFVFLVVPNITHASSAPYDEQLGLTFTSNFTAMAYNVTPVAQTDFSGYGPAYLLNGYTSSGYWYQVGVSWNWQELFGYSPNQFQAVYEVFAPNGTSIFPSGGGAGLINMQIPINEGDKILLNLYFSNGNVTMLVKDWNTGAEAWATYPAYGSTEFMGNSYSTASSQGFFTGLMTEWYHAQPWYQNQQTVTYSPWGQAIPKGWLWADEFYSPTRQVLFANQTQYPVVPYQSYYVTTHNATDELTSSGDFVTGATPPSKLSVVSYPTKTFQVDYGFNITSNNTVGVTVSGGVAPYSYTLYIDNRACLFKLISINSSANFNGGSLQINVSKVLNNCLVSGGFDIGQHSYNITVYDSNGNTDSTPETLLFSVNSDPKIILNTERTTIDAGQNAPADFNITGGTPPYNISYFLNGQDVGNTLTISTSGTYSLYVRLKDGVGYITNSDTISINVNPKPTIIINSDKTTSDVGSVVDFNLNGNNGTPPYTYRWYVNGQPVGNSSTFVFSPTSSGQYNIYANLTDSAQYSVTSTQLTLLINPKPIISSSKSVPSSTSLLYVNNTVNGAINVAGGTPPYTYKWYVNGELQPNSNSSSYIVDLNKTGIYNVTATAQDSVGQLASSSEIVNVSYNLGVIGGAIAVVIVVICIASYVLLRGRSRGKSKTPKKEKSMPKNEEQDTMKILKTRYAKGEITKKEYQEMKKEFE